MHGSHAKALKRVAQNYVKILVVSKPVNANALGVAKSVEGKIPERNVSALSRLDENRAAYQYAVTNDLELARLQRVVVWGNCQTESVFVDTSQVMFDQRKFTIKDEELNVKIVEKIQKRDKEVTDLKKEVPAMSIAKAAADQMRDWWCGKCLSQNSESPQTT